MQKPLSIAVISTSFPQTQDDIAGVFVRRLCDALKQQLQVSVLAPASTKKIDADWMQRYGLQLFSYAPQKWQILAQHAGGIPAAFRQHPIASRLLLPLFLMSFVFAIWRISKHADVLHANWLVVGFLTGLMAKLRSKPCITTLRGSDLNNIETSRFKQWMLKHVLSSHAYVVCVGQEMTQQIRRLAADQQHKVYTIANGVDADLLHMPIHKPSTSIQFLGVGSLVPNKAWHLAIEALAELKDFDWQLSLIGEGAEKAKLEALAAHLGCADRLTLLGACAPDTLLHYYQQADVMLLCSYREGRPNVVVEAMAAALPVIASAISGVRELIEHEQQGFLFANHDVAVLRMYMRCLMNDPDLCMTMGAKGRARILELGLSWQACAQQYQNLYQNMQTQA